MILQNATIPILNISFQPEKVADICLGKGQYSPDCLNKWFCPQVSSYFTHTALALIIVYIASTWLLWAYWRWIHERIPWKQIIDRRPFIAVWLGGDPLAFETKVKWELFVRDKLEKIKPSVDLANLLCYT